MEQHTEQRGAQARAAAPSPDYREIIAEQTRENRVLAAIHQMAKFTDRAKWRLMAQLATPAPAEIVQGFIVARLENELEQVSMAHSAACIIWCNQQRPLFPNVADLLAKAWRVEEQYDLAYDEEGDL